MVQTVLYSTQYSVPGWHPVLDQLRKVVSLPACSLPSVKSSGESSVYHELTLTETCKMHLQGHCVRLNHF